MMLGEEIALTPATLLFKKTKNYCGGTDCNDQKISPPPLMFAFDEHNSTPIASCTSTTACQNRTDITLPTFTKMIMINNDEDILEAPTCDRLLTVMERLWSGIQHPDLL